MSKEEIKEAIILCGGKGTRLQSVVSDRPKPMARIGGKPFLDIIIQQLIDQNVEHIILSTGYKSVFIEERVGLWNKKVQISISKESKPLGTGGAVLKAKALLRNESFIVLNGDSYCPVDIDDLFKFHLFKKANITIQVCKVDDVNRFGNIHIEQSGEISKFNEKTGQGAGLVNSGIYIFQKKILNEYEYDGECSLEKELFIKYIGSGIYGYISEYSFIDIGTPASYNQAQLLFKS